MLGRIVTQNIVNIPTKLPISASRCCARYKHSFQTSVLQKNIFATSYHCDSSVCSSIFKRSQFYKDEKKWRFLVAAVLGLGGALTFAKSQKNAHCAQVAASEGTKLWKDFKVTLYQYQTCPFCTKARTFLTYYQVPFKIVEVHPIFKEEIKFSEKYKKVPIVTIETKTGMQELHDSSLIVSVVGTYMANRGKRTIEEVMKDYPTAEVINLDGEKREVVLNKYWLLEEEEDKATQVMEDDPREMEAKWRQWTDDHLVHLISPNVYRTYREAYQAFDHHVKLGRFNGTWEGVVAKVFGSLAMWMISKKLKKKYCKDDDVRMDLYRACNEWCDAMGKKKFMGGDHPDLADLSVYAVINVMDGLVSFDDVTKYTRIRPWYQRVKKAVEEKRLSDVVA